MIEENKVQCGKEIRMKKEGHEAWSVSERDRENEKAKMDGL